MALNPFTGEIGGYESPSTAAGIGMASLETAGVQSPLAFRMLEQAPSASAAFFFSVNRGSNTILKGGYADNAKYRFKKDYFGQRITQKRMLARRATRLQASGKSAPFLRPAMRNTALMPRNLSRFSSLSALSDPSANKYSPFSASSFLNKTRFGSQLSEKITGEALSPGATSFGPGLLSFVTAGRKADVLERKALAGNKRAMRKLQTLDKNIQSLATINNPTFIKGVRTRGYVPAGGVRSDIVYSNGRGRVAKGVKEMKLYTGSGENMVSKIYKAGQFIPKDAQVPVYSRVGTPGFSLAKSAMVTGEGAGTVGVRRNMLASSMSGEATRYMAGYVSGAMGFADVTGLEGMALKGAGKAVEHMASESMAKRGLAMGAKYAGMALPGVNLLMTASLVYDLGKMAGEVVKSGINLARDAGKSLQGTIAKPMFGMGYKDTEAAATSRSRGVMAIQNSRLNMRSLLGNEASMMASYYG
jgi:hypothetical protein